MRTGSRVRPPSASRTRLVPIETRSAEPSTQFDYAPVMGDGRNKPVPAGDIARAIVLAVMALAVGITMRSASHKFTELFAGFGADLPGLTRFMMDGVVFAPYLALPIFLPGFILLVQRQSYTGNPRRLVIAAAVGFALYAAAFGVFLYAMYLPVFRIGSIV